MVKGDTGGYFAIETFETRRAVFGRRRRPELREVREEMREIYAKSGNIFPPNERGGA
ncbi:MAG: hypothetical protein KF819_17635 [Labilithrix sp.]|nr:hypothetical protein [Labilithrix sp.]